MKLILFEFRNESIESEIYFVTCMHLKRKKLNLKWTKNSLSQWFNHSMFSLTNHKNDRTITKTTLKLIQKCTEVCQ